MNIVIESLQNDKIKYLMRLNSDNRFRKKNQSFVIEGLQENQRAMLFGYTPKEFFLCEKIANPVHKNLQFLERSQHFIQPRINFVSENIYQKIAYRGTTEGIIGVYQTQEFALENFTPEPDSAIIIVESVEKPGNLGAILRSCEAFGINALVVTNPKTDFYNPNVLRSSVGCLFGMNFFTASNEEIYQFLLRNRYQIYTTYMTNEAIPIQVCDFKSKSALIFGTEHSGLSDFWLGKAKNITIPMVGTIDSLNLSNAVAISCYEVTRQKLQPQY